MKLKTINEWIDITGNSWVAQEQLYYQSMKYKVCVECFSKENLMLNNKRALIKSTDYYMCKECNDWWNNKSR